MKTYYRRLGDCTPDKDCSLAAAGFIYLYGSSSPDYPQREVRWQGIPTISKTPSGRFWCACYAGGLDEGPNNYVPMRYSDDGGLTWSGDTVILDHRDSVRLHEPVLWTDPDGILWLFWNQSYITWDGRGGVWASRCFNPDSSRPVWERPRRLCDGVLAVKPTVLADGRWLFPISIWRHFKSQYNSIPALENSGVYVSADRGETLTRIGYADIPDTTFDEHMLVERDDGSLFMLARTVTGIAISESSDGGVSWSSPSPFVLLGPSSRLYAGKLRSGGILLITHYNFKGRSNMTALLSRDGGRTWNERLLLDERDNVSYPDAYQDEDGRIYVVYDRERYGDKEILLASVTEEDITAGRLVSSGSFVKKTVFKAEGAVRGESERGMW